MPHLSISTPEPTPAQPSHTAAITVDRQPRCNSTRSRHRGLCRVSIPTTRCSNLSLRRTTTSSPLSVACTHHFRRHPPFPFPLHLRVTLTMTAFVSPALPLARAATGAASTLGASPLGGHAVRPFAPARPRRARPAAPVVPTAIYQTGLGGPPLPKSPPRTVTVTVQEKAGKGWKTTELEVSTEDDFRTALLAAGIDVYTLRGKLTNCGGGASCGTCKVDVLEGGAVCNGVSGREDRKLDGQPESWRLACQLKAFGDVTIRTKPQA